MAESIVQRINAMAGAKDAREMKAILDAALVDITTIAAALDTLAAKLNADTGVTDVDYVITHEDAVTLES